MNGFTNTILTLMLSWLRALINNIWIILGSEDGGSILQFLSANWKLLTVILCVGGFVVDRVIYFIRWRPYYVWSSKLNRLRRQRNSGVLREEMAARNQHKPRIIQTNRQGDDEPQSQKENYTKPYQASYARPARSNFGAATAQAQTSAYMPPVNTAATTFALQQAAAFAAPPDFSQATAHYAPLAQSLPKEHTPYQQPRQPPKDFEPVFDDDLGAWAQGDTMVSPLSTHAYQNPANGMESAFGIPMPEPIDYIRDMQAGFAPQVTPEMLYKPTKPLSPVPALPPVLQLDPIPTGSVHPGLGSEAFRQSFGLSPAGALPHTQPSINELFIQDVDEEYDDPFGQGATHAPTFMPYAQAHDLADERPAKLRNPFANIAKRARDLVGVEDEANRPTIHDLQPSVDMRTAFHEPVYPKPKDNEGGEF